jgi:protein TonB
LLWQSPPPLASIGIEAITVDVVLGSTTAAGLATAPSENEVQVAAPSPAQSAAHQYDAAPLATELPQDVATAARETAPEEKQEQAQEKTAETNEQIAVMETPRVDVPVPLAPPPVLDTIEATLEPSQPTTAAPTPEPAPERKRIDAPTAKKAMQQKQTAAPAPNAASGVGVGRSDTSANYNGRIAAHLARHKQYPAAARAAGSQGIATVSFSLDGGGRVTSVRLARGSGIASIDQEVVAMVRRASPFPPPPDGRGRNFTVPVRFNLR